MGEDRRVVQLQLVDAVHRGRLSPEVHADHAVEDHHDQVAEGRQQDPRRIQRLRPGHGGHQLRSRRAAQGRGAQQQRHHDGQRGHRRGAGVRRVHGQPRDRAAQRHRAGHRPERRAERDRRHRRHAERRPGPRDCGGGQRRPAGRCGHPRQRGCRADGRRIARGPCHGRRQCARRRCARHAALGRQHPRGQCRVAGTGRPRRPDVAKRWHRQHGRTAEGERRLQRRPVQARPVRPEGVGPGRHRRRNASLERQHRRQPAGRHGGVARRRRAAEGTGPDRRQQPDRVGRHAHLE